ncbi:MAG: hypothetical protein JXR40_09935 [Pontiellaceae bacterium]|nr:hypothetical protein [Pontiellaceae bacterium]
MNDALNQCKARLLEGLTERGCWEGELSSSPLATAVAAIALRLGGRADCAEAGLRWIREHRNADGGWGDSPESPSNFTATLLCRCTLGEEVGSPENVRKEILRFYGKDRTFSIPILTLCMLSGNLGSDWGMVPQLPFELAVFPHRFYRFLRMPVVSYALPALIAIGLVRHVKKPVRAAFWRDRQISRVLDILERIQPESGGFLEAAPLTGFVGMSLIGAGLQEHPVAQSCLRFLKETQRSDGSWAIDVNLSSWVTSLAARALDGDLSAEQCERIRDYVLRTQWREEHPFTHAAPGGWAWTDRSGGVPDADDTAGALMVLRQLMPEPETERQSTLEAARMGIEWLLELQNRDGGMPTFCKGWGRLPFDRSCPDLTAHMIRAFTAWRGQFDDELDATMKHAIQRGLDYLFQMQDHDGFWLPLWFGNQQHPDQENPLYGTVRVLEALNEINVHEFPLASRLMLHARAWLESVGEADLQQYCPDELALYVGMTGNRIRDLLHLTEQGTRFCAGPIGLYFASLWYSEKLYPLIFTTEALKRCIAMGKEADVE